MASFHDIAKATIYPPANKCIYCGAQDVELTDEHTLPDGLGGRHILPQASCVSCQKLINEEIEQYCLRTLLAHLRAAQGIKSSRKRPAPPLSIKVRRRAGVIERINVSLPDLPHMFALPVFPEPCFLSGIPVADSFDGWWWLYQAPNLDQDLNDQDAETILSETIDPSKMARLVAKIAHSHAWALWGGQFEPFLIPIILGKDKYFTRYIGGWGQLIEATPDMIHTFSLTTCRGEDGDENSYLLASMRFFSSLGGPVYYAVIGKLLAPWPLQERPFLQEKQ